MKNHSTSQDSRQELGLAEERYQLLLGLKEAVDAILEEAKQAAEDLRQEANLYVKEWLHEMDGHEQKQLASLVYWNLKPFILVDSIATATDGKSVAKWVYPQLQRLSCDRCGKEAWVPRNSRTEDSQYYVCDSCRQAERASTREWWTQREQEISRLRSMSYPEYLKTDHWQNVRRAALKRAKYRCQVCNTNQSVLHVHHRTYENRGQELARDVIVLCETCHRTFHENGQLAREG